MIPDDSALITSAQQGDLGAFDQLVERHQVQVYQLALRMSGNEEDAQDLAQEAFLRAYRSLKQFRGDAVFSTWIHRIAVHVSLDELRRRKLRPSPFTDQESPEDPKPLEESLVDPRQGVSEIAEQNERRKLIHQALLALPLHYRLVLVLYDLQGFSYEDIAGTLNMSMGTVKSRLNRARLLLKEKLEPMREQFLT